MGKQFADHDTLNGFEIEIPQDAKVGDLLDRLAIPKSRIGLVSVEGRLVKAGKSLKPGDLVRIYRPIFGG